MKRAYCSIGARLACGLLVTGCLGTDPNEEPELNALSDGSEIEQSEKVINGNPTSGDPSVVMLRNRTRGFCTGTLISPTVVLTAAHCLNNGTPAFVGFGVNGANNQVPVRSGVQHLSSVRT